VALKRVAPPPVEYPAGCDDADHYALKSLQAGNASAEQQRRALKWIVEKAAGAYDQPYRPGAPDETAFACGRMFVGQQIVHQLNSVRITKEKPRAR
jgi:hypothetical protein